MAELFNQLMSGFSADQPLPYICYFLLVLSTFGAFMLVKACNAYMDELEGIGQINKLPFDKLVEEYIDWYTARRKSSSVKALKTHTNNHLVPYFKSMDVFNMTTQDVMKFQNKKMKEGRSAEYLKKMHVFLVSILNHAMKYHDLKQNVASLVGNFEI